MEAEKLAVIGLVIIIVATLSVYIITNEDILDNLFGDQKDEDVITGIELGDCADVHYIGRYSSNDTVFSSSYDDVETRTGGTPIYVFVSQDKLLPPPTNYSTYASSPLMVQTVEEYISLSLSPLGLKEGFIEALINMNKEDNNKITTGDLSPDKAFGVSAKIGDILNLTPLVQMPLEYKIIGIQENALMPSSVTGLYGDSFGNKTTLFTVRNNLNYVGEILDVKYSSWENSTVVSKINETMIWMYTTSPYDIDENFTWIDFDSETGIQLAYPENTSSVTTINDSNIVITHSPDINTTIEESVYYTQYGMFVPIGAYTVEYLTDDKINVSYVLDAETGVESFKDFNRTTTIQRNETQVIAEDIPGQILEIQLMYLRQVQDDFSFSYHTLSDTTVYFELEILNIYETSQES